VDDLIADLELAAVGIEAPNGAQQLGVAMISARALEGFPTLVVCLRRRGLHKKRSRHRSRKQQSGRKSFPAH